MDINTFIKFRGVMIDAAVYCVDCIKSKLGLRDKSDVRIYVLTKSAQGYDHEELDHGTCCVCKKVF